MGKMMYVMNVSWSWIKQRPHFLAEYLNGYFSMDVFYQNTYRKKYKCNNPSDVHLIQLKRLPFQRFNIINKVNTYLLTLQMKNKVKNYKYIWITDIFMYNILVNYIDKKQVVIYDCMDNLVEFPEFTKSTKKTTQIIKIEKALIERSNYVFFSSEYLKKLISMRYKDIDVHGKSYIVNNAINLYDEEAFEPSVESEKHKYKNLVYIGTIAAWIDFDLILKSLSINSKIMYTFYGPLAVELPIHDRIIYGGLLEHKAVFSVMRKADALIMPFKLIDLVLAVNPVKLYEYIYACKPVLSIKYGETEKFSEYIFLYSNEKEYLDYVNSLVGDTLLLKHPKESYQEFAQANTWEARGREILKILKS